MLDEVVAWSRALGSTWTPSTTASAHRAPGRRSGSRGWSSRLTRRPAWPGLILTTSVTAGWQEPRDQAPTMMWVRRFYRDLFADTGGVPVPGDVTTGASINHPDIALADPEWNASDCVWYTMCHRGDNPRLQGVKLRWDPRDVFHHALSIRPTPSITAGEIYG
jgi:Berberine and berberine like